jgi:hypothetical protein
MKMRPKPKIRPGFKASKGHAAGSTGAGVTGSVRSPGSTFVVVNGQTIEVPAGQQYVPGSAGVKNPTIDPFLNAGDMMTSADEDFNLDQGLYDLDTALEKMRIDTEHSKSDITKSEGQAKSATIDNMIARGLFRSSVKDGEIYDIQATATMRRNFLDTALSTATIETGVRKQNLRTRHDAIQTALARKSVENAQAANDGAPDYLEDPTPGHLAPKPSTKPGAKPAAAWTAYGHPMHYPAPKPKAPAKPKAPSKPRATFKAGKGYAAR